MYNEERQKQRPAKSKPKPVTWFGVTVSWRLCTRFLILHQFVVGSRAQWSVMRVYQLPSNMIKYLIKPSLLELTSVWSECVNMTAAIFRECIWSVLFVFFPHRVYYWRMKFTAYTASSHQGMFEMFCFCFTFVKLWCHLFYYTSAAAYCSQISEMCCIFREKNQYKENKYCSDVSSLWLHTFTSHPSDMIMSFCSTLHPFIPLWMTE